jgi:SAM-dependent methyltransferase
MSMTVSATYAFDRAFPRERERLTAQAQFLDEGTMRVLGARGSLRGLRCAEIGAGAGSIALWMADAVGPTGRVVATDVDLRFLEALPHHSSLEIRRHDIVAVPLEPGSYDLVHTRLVLGHLPARDRALEHMVQSLRPGGWLVAEEYDLATAGLFDPPSALQSKMNAAVKQLFRRTGADPRIGIKLDGLLRRAGLEDVEAEGRLSVVRLGTPRAEALALKLEQFRERLVAQGLVTRDEVDLAIREVRQPYEENAVHYPPLMVAAWGRRPG